ncbi:uncharacterized protein LOC141644043 [Silene latifolia]|uniref:uncharacterized protein LOC141644043 n=1 Tax=Silene latifolia TaxID=37657 RepID=UPI003D775133
MAECLGVVGVEEQARYLGLPTVIGRSKKVITDIIRDKLCKKLQGWRGKILSRAGKEILIKAVANSLPTYVMSVFKIPANFCDELRSIVSKFWWGHEENKRGIHWVAWKKLVRPKGKGGLGFRDFRLFNIALLGKQAWRLVTTPDSLWTRIMKAKYFPASDFMSASLGHNPSYTWRSIFEARTVLERGMRRRIGDGNDTKMWGHAWLPNSHSSRIISPCAPGNDELMVAELMRPNRRGWDEEKGYGWLFGLDEGSLALESALESFGLAPREALLLGLWGGLLGMGRAGIGGRVGGRGQDVREWVEVRWNEMSQEECVWFMVDCWVIWEHRNKVVFDNIMVEPAVVVRRVRDVVCEGVGESDSVEKGRRSRSTSRGTGEGDNGWQAAREGYLKINVDAGIKEDVGVDTGIVCRDSRGEVLWGVSIARQRVWEAHVAEAVAVLDGLEEAARRGVQKLEVESDCLQVIEAIQDRRHGRSIFSPIIDDIVNCSFNFESIVWLHVSRINNCVAHALAHCSPRTLGRVV